jgi:hypothetical protein
VIDLTGLCDGAESEEALEERSEFLEHCALLHGVRVAG